MPSGCMGSRGNLQTPHGSGSTLCGAAKPRQRCAPTNTEAYRPGHAPAREPPLSVLVPAGVAASRARADPERKKQAAREG